MSDDDVAIIMQVVSKQHKKTLQALTRYRKKYIDDLRCMKLQIHYLDEKINEKSAEVDNCKMTFLNYSKGVQNVYNKFEDIEKQFKKLCAKDVSLIDNVEQKLKQAEERIKKIDAAKALRKFSELKDMIADMHYKLNDE